MTKKVTDMKLAELIESSQFDSEGIAVLFDKKSKKITIASETDTDPNIIKNFGDYQKIATTYGIDVDMHDWTKLKKEAEATEGGDPRFKQALSAMETDLKKSKRK